MQVAQIRAPSSTDHRPWPSPPSCLRACDLHVPPVNARIAVAGRMLRVTGRMQRAHNATHVLAEEIEDISALLDQLLAEDTGRQMAAETRTETWDSRR